MKVDGNCLCGHIEYEAEIDPETVAICHCTDCQTHSGTAYGVVVAIVDGRFRLLGGQLKTTKRSPTAEPCARSRSVPNAAPGYMPEPWAKAPRSSACASAPYASATN